MLEIERAYAARITENDVVIVWAFKPTIDDIGAYTVEIERTYDSESDDFDVVGTVPATTGYFRDSTVDLIDRWRLAIYRLMISGPDGIIESELLTAIPPRTPEAKEMARQHVILLRHSGVPVFVYKRKSIAEERCSTCWDRVTKKATDSKCPECLGTGWPQGFHPVPFLSMMDIRPAEKRTQPKDMLLQHQQTTAHTINVPVLAPRDVIIEPETGQRWRIGAVRPIEIHRSLVRQEFDMTALNLTDIEYKLLRLPRDPGMPLVRPLHTRPIRYMADEVPEDLLEVVVT